ADDDLARAQLQSGWHRVPVQLEALRWGVPSQGVLDAAVALQRRLSDQARQLAAFGDRLLLVVGQAPFTPERFEMTERGLVYAGSTNGDGRVTHDSAMLPGVRTWRVACDHGTLPQRKDAFAAYRELLETGTTSLIESMAEAPTTRSAAATVVAYSRPARSAQKANPPR